jgi:hypothetical protein
VAEAALFIGWGAPVRGREAKGLEVFGEGVQFFAQLQQDGTIESLDTVLLEPHGGDLYGFFLLRGTTAKLDELRGREDFIRLTARAGLIVERLGVVPAAVDEGIQQQITLYQEAVQDLT